MKYLGIDYGKKRVGIAVSDDAGKMAFPFTVLAQSKTLLDEMMHLVQTKGIGKIILGESTTLAGEPNPIQKDILRFKEELERTVSVPVIFEKEFYTSAQAEREQGKNDKLDASAATLILQSYIDKQKKSEVAGQSH